MYQKVVFAKYSRIEVGTMYEKYTLPQLLDSRWQVWVFFPLKKKGTNLGRVYYHSVVIIAPQAPAPRRIKTFYPRVYRYSTVYVRYDKNILTPEASNFHNQGRQ